MNSSVEFLTKSATVSLSRSSRVHSRRENLYDWSQSLKTDTTTTTKTTDNQHLSVTSNHQQHAYNQSLVHDNNRPTLSTTPSQSQGQSISPAMMFLSAFSPSAPLAPSPDAEGQLIRGYVLGPIIGYGGFSIIRRATSATGAVVALKIIRRSDLDKQADPSLARRRLNHESQVWASLNHEHMLPLFFSEHTLYADYFFTLFCPAGSLYNILIKDGNPALPHDDVGMMFRQIVRGVRYLHEVAGYVHRDIKLENVLVDEMGVCRICDFGMTRKIGQVDDDDSLQEQEQDDNSSILRHRSASRCHTSRAQKSCLPSHLTIPRRHHPRRHRNSTPIGEDLPPVHPAHVFQQGSLPYASPELLQPQASRFNGANPAQDIWALGVLLYALLTGRLPFSDSFEPRLQMKILHGVYDMPSNISSGAKHVLQGCLNHSAHSRWTIAKVDDLAWGVGWHQVDEAVPVPDKDQFEFVDYQSRRRSPSSSSSKSHSSPWHERDTDPSPLSPDDDDEDEEEARPRRSNRSLSRASVTTASSLSTRCTSRSISRPPIVRYPMSPTYDELSHSVVSASTSLSSVPPLDLGGSALTLIPSSGPPSPERGRRSKKAGFYSPPSRFAPSPATSSSRPSEYARDLAGDAYAYVDMLDSSASWASTIDSVAEAANVDDDHRTRTSSPSAMDLMKAIQEAHPPQKNKRAESTPPASTGGWPRRSRLRVKEDHSSYRAAQVHGGVGGFLREPSATPKPIAPKKAGTRSRSLGYGWV